MIQKIEGLVESIATCAILMLKLQPGRRQARALRREFLKPGDVVEIELESVGTLNTHRYKGS